MYPHTNLYPTLHWMVRVWAGTVGSIGLAFTAGGAGGDEAVVVSGIGGVVGGGGFCRSNC